jgi:hypothetical protein
MQEKWTKYLVCHKCNIGYQENTGCRRVDFVFRDGAPCQVCGEPMHFASKAVYQASKKYRRAVDVIRARCPYKTAKCKLRECDHCKEIKPKPIFCRECGHPSHGRDYCCGLCRTLSMI